MPSLDSFTSVLGYENAYHLLRRTTFNITKTRILEISTKTATEALDILFNFVEPSSPSPLNANAETILPTAAQPTFNDTLATQNASSLNKSWWLFHAFKDKSAQYKISLFLHLLFITDDDASFWNNYDYQELLRFHAKDNLKNLAIRVTSNPRMLHYLNNNVNRRTSPNQNYAREF